MTAKWLTRDEVPVAETKGPLDFPRAKALRSVDVQHRGRRITFVAADVTEADKDTFCRGVLALLQKRREANRA